MQFHVDGDEVLHPPENAIIRLQDHLPAGHIGIIETDPVVAFLHAVTNEDGKRVHIMPLVPDSTGGGFIEGIDTSMKIIGTTQAHPGGVMYSLYISGPVIDQRVTLGYEYPGQTKIDWEARAVKLCDLLTEQARPVIEMIERGCSADEIEKAIYEAEETIQRNHSIHKIVKELRERDHPEGRK